MLSYFVNTDYLCDCNAVSGFRHHYYNLITYRWNELHTLLDLKKADIVYHHGAINPYKHANPLPLCLKGRNLLFIEIGINVYTCEATIGNWFENLVFQRVLIEATSFTNSLKEEKPADPKYPHKCPYCGGPAWKGGMNNLDCKNKCLED